MNRSRRTVFFRIMATIMCAACVVVMCSGYQARAEPPADDTSNKEDEQPSTDTPENDPGENVSGDSPETPSDTAGNNTNSGNNTSNATNTNSNSTTTSTNSSSTTTTDNRTTDNSDNSRYSSTSDSNNTSTVNNYYTQQPEAESFNQPQVQTIVVPVGNTGSGEPLQQTIIVESPEGTTATGNLEGLTLNINVNTASQDQAANTSPVQQSGISWYQAIVLCLLSAILICLLKRR